MPPKRHAPLWYYLYCPIEFALSTWKEKLRRRRRDSTEEVCVKDKVVVITGANSGIGKQTALEMARRGAIVIMGCRNVERGATAREEIVTATGNIHVVICNLDLSSMSSVRNFAQEVIDNHKIVDILINNAGIYPTTRVQQLNENGWDLAMTTNHLGHFLLTNLLVVPLSQSSIGRVVTISSGVCCVSTLDTENLMMENGSMGLFLSESYRNSKLANALFSKEFGKRNPKIKAFSVCPGVVNTELFREYYKSRLGWLMAKSLMVTLSIPTEQSADTILFCSLCNKLDLVESGSFFRFKKRVRNVEKMLKDKTAKEVWQASEKFAGITNISS